MFYNCYPDELKTMRDHHCFYGSYVSVIWGVIVIIIKFELKRFRNSDASECTEESLRDIPVI